MDDIVAWFARHIPDGWFSGAPEIHVDREEIVVLGVITVAGTSARAADGDEDYATACTARVSRFREETRELRMRVAAEAEERFGHKVSWGVELDGERYLFTHTAVPVMTRLRFGERAVLDTLIDAGVARSRSEALAWCVRLVERHQGEWIGQLRDALTHVAEARAAGPDV